MLESKQSYDAQKIDETEPLQNPNVENSLKELNITRPAIRKNAASKIIHRTPFLKKPQPNIRNISKNSSVPQKEKVDIPAVENSQSSTNECQKEDNLEPKTIEDSKRSSIIESIDTNQENNQMQLLKESDVTEHTSPPNFENSGNELNSSISAVRKNATSAAVRRTPFIKKPVPNVRNVGKTGSNSTQEETSKTAPTEKSRRLSGCQDEEPSTPNTSAVPNSVKFPHITSILTSKKRNLKEKELPNKRRKYGKGDNPPERNKMTILDLIYYNPSENPMQNLKKKPVYNEIFSPKPSDEAPVENSTAETTEDTIRPVPKLVVNENGDINIDESSLIVQRNLPDPSLVETVTDETTYSSFRKKPSKQWGKNETAKFYRALSLVGTDFGLMEKLMPGRTRRELKLKFKREERHNLDYINRAMYDSQTFDISVLLEESLEDAEIPEQNDQKKKNGKRGRSKKKIDSSNSKIIALSDDESMDSSSQNSCEQNVAFDSQPESTSHDRLQSSPQLALSTPRGGKKDTDRKVEVSNARGDNEIVEIEFAYSRRNRKPKMLAEGFIDSNDLEVDEKDDSYDCNPESVMECDAFAEAEIELEENEILELQREVERNRIVSHATINSTEQSDLIITDINLSDTDLVSNVIADEVVSSKRTYTKKSKKPNVNVPRRVYQSNPVPRPSFTKYTPAEEYPSYKEEKLKFAPDRNLKTYTRSRESDAPKCPNFLVSSMKSPPTKKCITGKETTSLITSLNGSSNQSIVIPMTPEANAKDASCNSVMIFAKAPDQENILHLFMYNKTDTELNTVNCKIENTVSSNAVESVENINEMNS
ncbi:transcription factor TFIIIB component B'' homolog [Uloborus diversus]|uniref:transcription factor TFIIIB component B'' homolog n=1 Tax=Uloborus diversus TaxID=327109 RepID=UPI00240A581D|nr:transcription factor TFIIIB component B'' homolog [Uloborus diversus]